MARRRGAGGGRARDQVRIVPDLVRLTVRLAGRRDVPVRVRARLYLAVVYNAQPINLIRDFVPLVGMMDDALVLGWALRYAVRWVDPAVVRREWPGSEDAYRAALRIVAPTPGARFPRLCGHLIPSPADGINGLANQCLITNRTSVLQRESRVVP